MKNMLIRLLACLMMAAMLISCVAMAETAEAVVEETEIETVEWVDANGLVNFSVPADWTSFDSDLIVSMIKDMVDQGLLDEAGANEYAQQLMAQVESVYAFFYAADFVGNMNVTVADTMGESMIDAFDVLKTSFEAQYTQMGATVNSFEIAKYGEYDVIVCKIEYLGSSQTQILIQTADCASMLTFTFAGSAQDAVDLVMNSVVLNPVVEAE